MSATDQPLKRTTGNDPIPQGYEPVGNVYQPVTVTDLQNGRYGQDVVLNGSNAQVFNGTATWANSAAANTEVHLDIALPTPLQGDALYEIVVRNPSAVTALTVVVKNKETFSAVARYPELTRFGVAVNSPEGKAVLVQGWMLGEGARLTLSNDTVLGPADGFTADVRIRRI